MREDWTGDSKISDADKSGLFDVQAFMKSLISKEKK